MKEIQIKNNQTIFKLLIYVGLLLFLASLVTEKYFAKSYVYITMLVGAGFIVYYNYKGLYFSKKEENLIRFGVAAYLLTLTGFFFQHPEYTQFHRSAEWQSKHLLPLLLLPMIYTVRHHITIEFLAWCLVIGVFTAFGITIVAYLEGFVTLGARGGGQVHGAPIIFGNLAMLFGVLSLVLSSYFFQQNKKLFYILILSGLLGVLSSLLSGTRGGWIVLLTLPFLIIAALEAKKPWKWLLLYFTFSVCFIAALLLTENPIGFRIVQLFNEVKILITNPDYSGGSLGARLVFWEVSWSAFLSSPIIGIGIGEFYAYKQALVEAGAIPGHLAKFKHSHNEFLSILSNHGLVGVIFYISFFTWLFFVFKTFLSSKIIEIKRLGLLGIVTLICYFEFSLTESFFSSQLGLAAFYFIIVLLVFLGGKYDANKAS